ncbi:MAG: phosphoglycerate dehydrogenase [Candidatus Latescibacteria bacterium]|nr:phosphoglycerate dehydrogenase [Candidatus Latescibacterota bacterium]
MSKARVFTSCEIEFAHAALQLLEKANLDLTYRPPHPGWPDEQTRASLPGIHALLAGSERIAAHTLDQADSLKIVARNGVGFDKVDLEECTARGIMVTNTPGAMADAVADLAFALLLTLVRQTAAGDHLIKEGGYEVAMGEDLSAMTLGLVGCGRIGAEVVRRALGFKMRVLVCDPWVAEAHLKEMGATPASLEELLAQADAVTLHTPLSLENQNLVNARFLAAMKRGSYLINTARGGLVDEPALIAALRSGQLAGAGLDCQASEPPTGVSLELVRMEQVVATPHAGSKTLAARKHMALMAAQSIVDCLEGRVPEHLVNREVLKRLGR